MNSYDIRYKLFRSYTLISIILSLTFAAINAFNRRPFINILTGLIVAGICSLIYFMSSKKKLYSVSRIMFLAFFTFLYVPFSYPTTPGTYSAMPYLLILVIFIMTIVAVKTWEYVFPCLVVIESLVLFRLELWYPEWFYKYASETYRIQDLSINFFVVASAILVTVFFVMRRYNKDNERLYDSSVTDALTGVYNKRYFEEYAGHEFNRAKREGQVFSIIFIDINNFKRINDEYGHQRGDQVLMDIGQKINENIRSYDVCARYGGDEFIIILPNTDEDDAKSHVRRLEKVF